MVADFLSRPPDIGAVFGDFQTVVLLEIAAEQQTDSEINDMIRDKTHSLCLEKVTIPCSSEYIWVDKSCNVPRILVPQKLRFRILDEVHSLAHPGVKVTRELIGQRFVWKGMRKDVAKFVRTCIPCQQSKIVRHNKTPLQRFKTPDARFAHIHCDIVGPLVECNGLSYFMIFIDRFARHIEVAPLKSTSAKECADAFLHTWVARLGCPTELTCDRGVQFTSHLWNELCSFLGYKLNHSCAYRPQANGFCERVHRTLKAALKAQREPHRWFFNLPWVLLVLRSAPKSDHGFSSAELTFGTTLRLPGKFFESPKLVCETTYVKELNSLMSSLKAPPTSYHTQRDTYVEKALATCNHVFVRDETSGGFHRAYKGPFRVVSKHAKFFTLDLGNRIDTVSVDRLKAANLLKNVTNGDCLDCTFKGNAPCESSNPVELAAAPLDEQPAPVFRNRLGRIIHMPARFDDYALCKAKQFLFG